LKAHGFQSVKRVKNPTGAQLREAIEDFKGRYGYNDRNRLFFFFSGHGYTLDDDQKGYFVPSDAPNPEKDQAGFRRVALWMQQFVTWAEDMRALHVFFAFDSCFSGTIFRMRSGAESQSLTDAAAPVRQFLSAGGPREPVPAQSTFTPLVVRALNGAADRNSDGFVTGTELSNWVQGEVIASKIGQTPQFGKLTRANFDLGEIVFQPPKGAAASDRATAGNPAADKLAIERTLKEYRLAYEARDVKQVQRVFPSVPDPEALARDFAEMREQKMDIKDLKILVTSGTEASATGQLIQRAVLGRKVGMARNSPKLKVTFSLEKVAGRWIIVSRR
jgi:hypothetical protein